MTGALYALSALATVLAWLLARRDGEHRPIAVLLSVGLGVDVVRRALKVFYVYPVIRPLRGHPLMGLPLAVSHVNDALFLVWPAAVVACALVVFRKRSPWPAFAAWLAVVVALVVVHPYESTGALGKVLTAGELVSLALSVGFAVTWYTTSKGPTTTAQLPLAVILAGELATIVGPWRIGAFDNWNVSQVLYLLVYVLLNILQGGFLWQSRPK